VAAAGERALEELLVSVPSRTCRRSPGSRPEIEGPMDYRRSKPHRRSCRTCRDIDMQPRPIADTLNAPCPSSRCSMDGPPVCVRKRCVQRTRLPRGRSRTTPESRDARPHRLGRGPAKSIRPLRTTDGVTRSTAVGEPHPPTQARSDGGRAGRSASNQRGATRIGTGQETGRGTRRAPALRRSGARRHGVGYGLPDVLDAVGLGHDPGDARGSDLLRSS
jgi:hypothetical protein